MYNLKIELDDKKDIEGYVWFNLHKYNQQHCNFIRENSSYAHNNKIGGDFIIYDDDKIIGGALGHIIWGWYHLTDFFINEEYRKSGIGTQIIQRIEMFAKENKAIGVKVDSWSFQAPEFYKKLGYIEWARFEDCPPDTTHYYLYKKF